ncbi:MAG: hypothetical protein ACP5OP_00260 [Leptospirillia bacterium]
MKLRYVRASGVLVVGLLMMSGCHSTPKEPSQSGKTATPPVKLASPTPIDGGAHSFIPYADKPPLGTPVETH